MSPALNDKDETGFLKACPLVKPVQILEEVFTMTKITVDQAVAAVKATKTVEGKAAVLEQCTKPQLHAVFLAVTGNSEEKAGRAGRKPR